MNFHYFYFPLIIITYLKILDVVSMVSPGEETYYFLSKGAYKVGRKGKSKLTIPLISFTLSFLYRRDLLTLNSFS